jgi:phosphohistidine phosphatase
MKLYLVQHGDAVAKEVDPERPLSARGRADVQRTASFLGQAGIRIGRVLHSGKQRAEQTAELLAAAIGAGRELEQISGIDPLDPTDTFAQTVNAWTEDTLVVGHLPFMGKLVSRLIVGDEAVPTVAFLPGAVLCLERGDAETWAIAWMIRPELLAGRNPEKA